MSEYISECRTCVVACKHRNSKHKPKRCKEDAKSYDLRKPLDIIRYIVKDPFNSSSRHVAVTGDGAIICSKCVKENYRSIYKHTKSSYNLQWNITKIVFASDYENASCSQCNRILE